MHNHTVGKLVSATVVLLSYTSSMSGCCTRMAWRCNQISFVVVTDC